VGNSLVSVSLVCYNGLEYLRQSLPVLLEQTYSPIETIIVDNCSTDGSVEYIQEHHPTIKLIVNNRNTGFCAANNQGIRASKGEFVLILNQDVLLTPTFAEEMVRAMSLAPGVGIVSGKLYRIGEFFTRDEQFEKRVLDSTGMYWIPSGRHPDRGAGEPDTGQYDRVEYVFGASGAAALLRRAMLEEVAFECQYFDEDFYFGHEDADLSWRAQIMGWRALYTPRAVAYHVRFSRFDNRREMPAWVNRHSVKNRFMLRVKNMTFRHFLQYAPSMMLRDVLAMGYIILVERSSLGGIMEFLALLPRNMRKRKFTLAQRRVPDSYIRRWFDWHPVSYPFPCGEATLPNRMTQ
jgi:GT2 family glycosyltransferase